jgi:hypothetical protein
MSEPASALPRSRAAVRQLWSERLDRFATSGLSVVAFCRNEGLFCHPFSYWKHKRTRPVDHVRSGRDEVCGVPREAAR